MNGSTGKSRIPAHTSRVPAFFCMIAFLLCETISLPHAEMGIGDDWSYVRTAQLLAQTGHIHYVGWATGVIGWQLYPAAALIRLFGFSYTISRLICVIVGGLTAFLMQRTFVRAGISQGNATLGTLAIVLAPLYMELSSTFMTDVPGLFAVVVCFYGCVRALQSDSCTKAGLWICFAALTNAVFGTSRQIAWLGVLVMVPSTLWLVRRRREAAVLGSAAMLVGWVFVAFCRQWWKRQPYAIPSILPFFHVRSTYEMGFMIWRLVSAILEIPFLILPIVAAYMVLFPGTARRFWKAVVIGGLGYAAVLIAAGARYFRFLEPRLGDWVTAHGGYLSAPPQAVVLPPPVRILLTAVTLLSMLCATVVLWRVRERIVHGDIAELQKATLNQTSPSVSWGQLLVLVGPFTTAYFVALIPLLPMTMLDRYLLPLTFVLGLGLVRAFQDFVRPSLPAITAALVVIIAMYSIGVTHDMFASYRALEDAADEIRAAGLPPGVLDGSWEYDSWVEMMRYGHINEETANLPNGFIHVGDYQGWSCDGDGKLNVGLTHMPHFSPRYGLSFDPNHCAGPAGFAPVRYYRWLWFRSTSFYIVKYQPRKVADLFGSEPVSER